jgi:GNAT acetyltransferase-like protein
MALSFEIYSDLAACAELWRMFSPQARLFDVWEYRVGFFDPDYHRPHFILGRDAAGPVGLVPLWQARVDGRFQFFGGWFPERNTFYLRDKSLLPCFLAQCPPNTCLEGIDQSEGAHARLEPDEETYYVDLTKFQYDLSRYVESLSSSLRRDCRAMLKRLPTFRVHRDRLPDFLRLIELNIETIDDRRRRRDDESTPPASYLESGPIRTGVEQALRRAQDEGRLAMISIEVEGEIQGVDAGIMWGDWFHVMVRGATRRISNLGKLMNLMDINAAVERRARFVDFFATAAWKKRWNFEREMLLKFEA